MDINAIETLRAPKVYDTGNFFEYADNYRTDRKDYQPYWFTQGGKLEFGNARNQTSQIDNDEYAIQVRNGQNGYYATEDTVGGNANRYRIEKGIWQKPFDIGNANRPWQVIQNNQNKMKSTVGQTCGKPVATNRGYSQPPSIRSGQKRSKEGFKEALTTTPYGPGSAYTSEPNPLTSNNSSGLQPQLGIPDEFIDKRECRDACKEKVAGADIRKGISNLAKDFGDTVSYYMTFGKIGKRPGKEGYKEAAGNCGTGCVLGIIAGVIIALIFIWFLLYLFNSSVKNITRKMYNATIGHLTGKYIRIENENEDYIEFNNATEKPETDTTDEGEKKNFFKRFKEGFQFRR